MLGSRVTFFSPASAMLRINFYLYVDRPTTLFYLVLASGPQPPVNITRTHAFTYVRTYVRKLQFGKRPLLNSNLRGIVVKLRPRHYFKSPSIAHIDRARSILKYQT